MRHMTSFALGVAEACDKRYLEGYTAILLMTKEKWEIWLEIGIG